MSPSSSKLLRNALAGLALAGAFACGHKVDNGFYAFTASDGGVVKDTCHIAPASGSLWDGTLTTTGEEIYIHYNLAGPDQVQLTGFFKSPEYGAKDGFLADGTSSEVLAPVPNVDGGCLSDNLVVHMDATLEDSQHLSGLVQARYSLTPPSTGPCSQFVSCELEAHFTAELLHR